MSEDIKQFVWLCLAALAGAITALSYRPFDQMSRAQIFFSVFVGASFAIFVGPWVVGKFSPDTNDLRWTGACYYLLATGANTLIPLMVKKVSAMVGDSK